MSVLARLFTALLSLCSEPTPMSVPATLLQQTSMPEPSGLVFSPELDRYLVVSDDTGIKEQGTGHAPWIFTMSRDGALDSTPLRLQGIDKLNDAEAICRGPRGSYLLATSHSKNRKGKEKAARHQLLKLELVRSTVTVAASLDLATAILASGVLPPGGLDIEALAFRNDSLYVGLKAPQTAQGAALILRIDKIAEAFEKGELAPKQVQRFAVVPLQVAGPTGPVIEGISDMHFLGDGSLVLLANSPKGMPSDGGGALWWLKPGAMPELLRRFPGYKPEGITTTAEGTALLIVFDRDRQQPAWLLQPLPSAPAKAPADQAASLKPKKGH